MARKPGLKARVDDIDSRTAGLKTYGSDVPAYRRVQEAAASAKKVAAAVKKMRKKNPTSLPRQKLRDKASIADDQATFRQSAK